MRYQDWDVLLFPASEEAAHVPVKEFRTQCYVELHDHVATPLLTTFIPAMKHGTPFQVSIHSWMKTGPLIEHAVTGTDGRVAKEVWQVKVVIDGHVVAAESFGIDVTWPQIMTNDTQAHKLRFPQFHRTLLSQNSWNPSDLVGRIRVELSSGFLDEKIGRYVKVSDHVIFAFQPGPIDILEHNGIAWPNQRMYQNPLLPPAQGYAGMPNGVPPVPPTKHRRIASTNTIQVPVAMGGLATPPLTAQFNHPSYAHDINAMYDAGSRSTSAYSTLTDSAAPLLKKDGGYAPAYPVVYPTTYPTPQAEAHRKGLNLPFNIRLPSDQLDLIIKAIQVPQQTQEIGDSSSTMPPPPLPQHVTAPKDDSQTQHRPTSFGLTFPPFGEKNTSVVDGNKREDSRFSDISMHPSCSSFPACTTEDAQGHIIHNADCEAAKTAPSAPASVIRGRKEGSSPTKPRDFFSTILDTTAATNPPSGPMETQSPAHTTMDTVTTVPPSMLTSSSPVDAQGSKKRTRSALRSLNINDGGSPEKMDFSAVTKPPRKASRASVSSNNHDQENAAGVYDNVMDVA